MFLPGEAGAQDADNSQTEGNIVVDAGAGAVTQEGGAQTEVNPLMAFVGGTGNNWVNAEAPQEEGNSETEPAVVETEPAAAIESPVVGNIAIPDKFKNADGSVNAESLLKSYVSLEQKLGEQGNQLGQVQTLQQKIEELTGIVQAQQGSSGNGQADNTQGGNAPDVPAPVQFTEEQISEMNEKFLEDYYANPLQTMNSLVSSVAKNAVESAMQPFMSQVQPVVRAHEESIQTQKWNQQTNAVAQAHPEEFEGLKPLMSQVINEQNEIINALPDNINKVEYIFNQAKAIDAQQKQASLQAQIRTPEQMLADPAFLQSIMQNEQIKQMFAQSQVEAIRSGRPPVVISNQPAGASPATPAPQARTVKEASGAALNFFRKIVGE